MVGGIQVRGIMERFYEQTAGRMENCGMIPCLSATMFRVASVIRIRKHDKIGARAEEELE